MIVRTLGDVPRIAWVAGIVVVLANVFVRGLQLLGVYREDFQLGDLVVFPVETALWTTIAVVAVASARWRRFGWLVVASQAIQPWILGHIPGSAWWSVSWVLGGVTSPILAHAVLTFPSGRFAGRRELVIAVLGYAVWIVPGFVRMPFWDVVALFPCSPDQYCAVNVFLVRRDDVLVQAIDLVAVAARTAVQLVVVAVLLGRARVAAPASRSGLRYVAAGFAVNTAMYAVDALGYELELWEVLRFTQGVAATIIWDVLPVALLAGLFATRLARGRVASLAVRLAAGVPTGGLGALLAETLRDPSVRLAFPAPEGDGLVDSDGRPIDAPAPDDPTRAVTRLERDGQLLALLIHDPAIDEGDPEFVPAVGSVAQMALVNERLSAQVKAQLEEVRASRARIVDATDAERRRVERELHDGAQQRLIALSMRLDAARTTVAGARELIDRTTAELGTAIEEVRQLARGLNPTILTEAGLRAAVEALAERTPIPVEVDVPEGRYPERVEATVYFVVAEALTNVAKYAGASGILVHVREVDGQLQVRVQDDGRGGADPAAGSGLRGLVDRVAAAGGHLHVDSPPGAGTRILAEMPVG